ncbi:sensor histidine kinase [Mucilaginibacter ginsenosidivorax]|uniref:histidine kinase n=1 Tax=Mucilaginibacter ginsenosidivorax TaxID=862126 RepID=A0A5B8VVU8_9SPHI|nr:PAS domain-containing sensor histidine kinase [Mucilaginibacter ginsenosidivorax]QEC74735.1 PAS domain-containing sensor histidine kinase [Mucilaginibacter ginsenosidivorax]
MERNKSELEKIMAFSLDLICTMDEEGRFVKVSAASGPVLGYVPEELKGRFYWEFVYPEDCGITRNYTEAIMAGRMVQSFENRYVGKDGNVKPVLWSSNWDAEDRIMYCIARDGSGKKQSEALQRSLEEGNIRYEYVTKATSDAVWDWNLEKNTLYWGEGFTSVFGYNLKEITDDIRSWTEHVHPEDAQAVVSSVYHVIDRGETNWKKEYRYQRADGSFAEVVDRGFVIRDASGKAIRMVGAMHDISERKKSLAELKQFAEDLYKRNRELHQFGYVVSHNLRLPVANIIGIADLMEAERDCPETLDFCIAGMKASGSSLDEVIRDLSTILSVTDGSMEITKEPIDVLEIIHKVKADLNQSILETQAVIHVPEGNYLLHSHKAYLYSVFYNLINNAIKYRSTQPPTVTILVEDSPESLVVQLTDNGIGIDLRRHQDDLFRPYKRFNNERKGKGLGLFLVKSHMDALHGTISIQSEPKKGTSFEMTFLKEK